MRQTRWEFKDGRVAVEQHPNVWILYPSPGFVEYVGDAEGLIAYLTKKGIKLP